MLLTILMILTSEASALQVNMSSMRMGKAKLLEDLRAHSAFKDKLSPGGDDNIVNISFQYRHYEVLMVDEVEQAVTSVGYVDISWNDPDLTWNKTEYGGVETISIDYNEMWHPTVLVTNAADPDYMIIDRMQTMTLVSSGTFSYKTPVYLKTTCNMDLKYYPFDTQSCDIFFMPFLDDAFYRISASKLITVAEHFSVTGQWRITYMNLSKMVVAEQGGVELVRFTMDIERRYLFYLLCVICPMLLTTSMTSMVFWIPPSSGEKISFLVTVFVSNAVFVNFIAEAMPRSMSVMPALALFLVMVNLQCVIAMIETIFVIRKWEQEQRDTLANQRDSILEQLVENAPTKIKEIPAETDLKIHPESVSGLSDPLATRMFKKFSFLKLRLAPLDKFVTETKHRIRKRCHKCTLHSSTWDMIFFWTFHIISVPCYYLLFKV